MQTKKDAAAQLSRSLQLTLTAMFVVLTLIFTLIGVNILGLPGGYLHLGNIPVFAAAILFGKKIASISAGFGMATFDLIGGYTLWAPFTFVIGLAMGFLVGALLQRSQSTKMCILAFSLAAVVKLTGYYFAEVFLYGNWIVPFSSMPANTAQVVVAAVVVLLIRKPLQSAVDKIIFHKRKPS